MRAMKKATFSEMIRAVLEAYQWTETDLAAQCGCRQSTINRLKLGQVEDPFYSTGSAIERLYIQRPRKRRA